MTLEIAVAIRGLLWQFVRLEVTNYVASKAIMAMRFQIGAVIIFNPTYYARALVG